jgi:hypothetical protein
MVSKLRYLLRTFVVPGLVAFCVSFAIFTFGARAGAIAQLERDNAFLKACVREQAALEDRTRKQIALVNGMYESKVCTSVCQAVAKPTDGVINLTQSRQEPTGGCVCFFSPDL